MLHDPQMPYWMKDEDVLTYEEKYSDVCLPLPLGTQSHGVIAIILHNSTFKSMKISTEILILLFILF